MDETTLNLIYRRFRRLDEMGANTYGALTQLLSELGVTEAPVEFIESEVASEKTRILDNLARFAKAAEAVATKEEIQATIIKEEV